MEGKESGFGKYVIKAKDGKGGEKLTIGGVLTNARCLGMPLSIGTSFEIVMNTILAKRLHR